MSDIHRWIWSLALGTTSRASKSCSFTLLVVSQLECIDVLVHNVSRNLGLGDGLTHMVKAFRRAMLGPSNALDINLLVQVTIIPFLRSQTSSRQKVGQISPGSSNDRLILELLDVLVVQAVELCHFSLCDGLLLWDV